MRVPNLDELLREIAENRFRALAFRQHPAKHRYRQLRRVIAVDVSHQISPSSATLPAAAEMTTQERAYTSPVWYTP